MQTQLVLVYLTGSAAQIPELHIKLSVTEITRRDMKTLKVKMVDFWPGFDPEDNFITDTLKSLGEVRLVDENPDYLFYSCFGRTHLKYTDYNCIKIFYTGENLVANYNECDYSLGFDYLEFGDRHLRYPLFAKHTDLPKVQSRQEITTAEIAHKDRFCNFIYSNGRADPVRDRFFHMLSTYKKVDAGGKHLRNSESVDANATSDDRFRSKINYQSNFKFSIAFENSEFPGYTTEKILDAFAARTVPIYWGNPLVEREFNPRAFINAYNFDNLEALAKEVIRVDSDPEAYLDMLNAPVFNRTYIDSPPYSQRLSDFLRNIIEQPVEKARRRPRYGRARDKEIRRHAPANRIRRLLKLRK